VARRAVAEALGTAFLLAAVVGSGIMGERLAGGTSRLRSSPIRLPPEPCWLR
jgi:glycerol uptake facilitator-like aquaporin